MASRLFLFLSLCLMCSCTSQHTSFARYHENGKMKPTVLVGSIEDLSDSGLSWNISQELQQEIKKSFLSSGNLYVNESHYPLGLDEEELGRYLAEARTESSSSAINEDFVAFLDLLEHDIVAYDGTKAEEARSYTGYVTSMLRMKMRIKILDIKSYPPKIVLQEIYTFEQPIPRKSNKTNYEEVVWGTDAYLLSPVSLGHRRLIKGITKRIEDYIEIRQSMQ
jgi:hypothetical protein